MREEQKSERKSIQVNGDLTPEAAAIANPQFAAAQKAAQPMYKRIEESRRLSGEDMAWTANTLPD